MSTLPFPSGLYNLRASPAAGLGGLYATANGPNETVTVAPETPPFAERQVWRIQVVNPEAGLYTITGTVTGGHWYPKDREPIPERPVITSGESFEWYISYLNVPNVPQTITIRAPTRLIGATLYAGTDGEKHVVIKSIPVIPDAPEAPYWQFKPVKLD